MVLHTVKENDNWNNLLANMTCQHDLDSVVDLKGVFFKNE